MIDISLNAVVDRQDLARVIPALRLSPPSGDPLAASFALNLTEIAPSRWDQQVSVQGEMQGNEELRARVTAACQAEVGRFPKSASIRTNLAVALVNEGKRNEAKAELEIARKLEPGHYLATVLLARLRASEGDLEEAAALYRDVEPIGKRSRSVLLSLAVVEIRLGKQEEAKESLKRLLEVDPDNPLALYYLGSLFLRQRNWKEAVSRFRRATHTDVRSPLLYHGLGVAYILGEDWSQAERAFRTALSIDAALPESVYALADVLLRQTRAEEASKLLSDFLTTRPNDFPALERLAIAYLNQRRHADMLSSLRTALASLDQVRDRDAYARTLNNMGVAYTRLGRADEAQSLFERASKTERPEKGEGFLNLVRVLLQRNMAEKAVELLELRLSPLPAAEGVSVLRATAYAQAEKFDESISILQEAITRADEGPLAFAMLGGFLADERADFRGALDVLQAAQRRFPFDRTLLNNLAYVYLEAGGRTLDARACLEKAPPGDDEKNPGSVVSLAATHGLLAIWEGRVLEGVRGYRHAAKLARTRGLIPLEKTVLQKMHLELARRSARVNDRGSALAEIRKGLQHQGRASYRRDLLALSEELTPQVN